MKKLLKRMKNEKVAKGRIIGLKFYDVSEMGIVWKLAYLPESVCTVFIMCRRIIGPALLRIRLYFVVYLMLFV